MVFGLLLVDIFITWLMSWLIISTVIYLAARMVVGDRASFKASLSLTFIGVLVAGLSLYMSRSIFGSIIGLGVAALLWLWLTKAFFHTGWLQALGITLLAIILAIIISLISALILGLSLSAFFSYSTTPLLLH